MGERLSEAERDVLTRALEADLGCKPGAIDMEHGPICASTIHVATLYNGECEFAANVAEQMAPAVERILAARADRLAGKVRALTDEWTHATCQTDGAPCSWHRVSAECAAELLALLDDEPTPDRPPLPDRVDAVLRRSRNMREGLVEAIESGELAP